MNADEIIHLANAFYELGVSKIRLTGGEPLLNPNFDTIITHLGSLPIELGVTTNGFLLDKHFSALRTAKISRLNISLDTLKADRFRSITGRNGFQKVFSNILDAVSLGFKVKINAVIIKGSNDDEIIDFAQLTRKYNIDVRFIEFMPFRNNNWNFGKTVSGREITNTLKETFQLNEIERTEGQTADLFQIEGAPGKVGLISTLSHPFCNECNRIRVMADGKLKNCLFGDNEIDIITPFREGKDLKDFIQTALALKPAKHGGINPFEKKEQDYFNNRNMHTIGG
jgi:cyclic pyranopterin phosphate synthase